MKNNINILMYKDIKTYLTGENLKYLVYEYNGEFEVKELPPFIIDYASAVRDYFAYDYDELSDFYKEFYKDKFKSLSNVSNNKYKIETKVYKIKKNNQ